MRHTLKNGLILFVLTLILSSCANDAKNKVKSERLKLITTKTKVLMNQSFMVKVELTDGVDSLIFPNYKPLKKYEDGQLEFVFNKPGGYRIEVIGLNSKENTRRKGVVQVNVVSGITPKRIDFEIIETKLHAKENYTQGLEINSNYLYESTGQYGESKLIKYNYPELTIDREINLSKDYFGEGLTVVGDSIYQLTWQENVCFVYDKNLEKISELPLPSPEGWGIAHGERELYLTDGTGNVYTTNYNLRVKDISQVYFGEKALTSLNELEYVNGKVWANVYGADQIVRINPKTGVIDSFVDFSRLRAEVKNKEAEVLNGIAYDTNRNAFLITGKNWEKLFIVKLQE